MRRSKSQREDDDTVFDGALQLKPLLEKHCPECLDVLTLENGEVGYFYRGNFAYGTYTQECSDGDAKESRRRRMLLVKCSVDNAAIVVPHVVETAATANQKQKRANSNNACEGLVAFAPAHLTNPNGTANKRATKMNLDRYILVKRHMFCKSMDALLAWLSLGIDNALVEHDAVKTTNMSMTTRSSAKKSCDVAEWEEVLASHVVVEQTNKKGRKTSN